MTINDVQHWLTGPRPFAAGVEMWKSLVKPPPGNSFQKLLDRGETGYAKERLAEALQQLLEKAQRAQEAVAPPKAVPHPGMLAKEAVDGLNQMDDWPVHRYPVELQDVKRKAIDQMREQDTLLGVLHKAPTKSERYQTALRMKDLDDQIHAAFYRLDVYRATGTDVGAVTERPMNMAELIDKRNSLRSIISRAEKGTRPCSPERLALLKAERDIIQQNIDALKQG